MTCSRRSITTPLEPRATLVFAPEGRLVEQYSCDPFSRNLARATRSWPGLAMGAGPRASIALVRGAPRPPAP